MDCIRKDLLTHIIMNKKHLIIFQAGLEVRSGGKFSGVNQRNWSDPLHPKLSFWYVGESTGSCAKSFIVQIRPCDNSEKEATDYRKRATRNSLKKARKKKEEKRQK